MGNFSNGATRQCQSPCLRDVLGRSIEQQRNQDAPARLSSASRTSPLGQISDRPDCPVGTVALKGAWREPKVDAVLDEAERTGRALEAEAQQWTRSARSAR